MLTLSFLKLKLEKLMNVSYNSAPYQFDYPSMEGLQMERSERFLLSEKPMTWKWKTHRWKIITFLGYAQSLKPHERRENESLAVKSCVAGEQLLFSNFTQLFSVIDRWRDAFAVFRKQYEILFVLYFSTKYYRIFWFKMQANLLVTLCRVLIFKNLFSSYYTIGSFGSTFR